MAKGAEAHYKAEVTYCWSCAAIQRATKKHLDKKENSDAGLKAHIVKTPEARG